MSSLQSIFQELGDLDIFIMKMYLFLFPANRSIIFVLVLEQSSV